MFLIFDGSPMRFVYHRTKILSIITKQISYQIFICIFLVLVTSAPIYGDELRGREDSCIPCKFSHTMSFLSYIPNSSPSTYFYIFQPGEGELPMGHFFFKKRKRTTLSTGFSPICPYGATETDRRENLETRLTKRRDKETKHVFCFLFCFCSGGWIFNLVPRIFSDRNSESRRGQL